MGRHSDYKPEYCEHLIEHMSQGLSFDAFAGVIECNPDTLYEWCKRHPEFAEAKKIARAKCLIWWEQKGQEGLFSESWSEFQGSGGSRSLNASLWIFNMKNRFKWRDKQPDEEDGKPQKSITLNYTLPAKKDKE